MRSQADEPLGRGREFRAAQQLQAEFRIPAVPMARAPGAAEHVTIGDTDESQMVLFLAAEGRNTIRRAGTHANRLRVGVETLSDAMLPDAWWTRLQTYLGLRQGVCWW